MVKILLNWQRFVTGDLTFTKRHFYPMNDCAITTMKTYESILIGRYLVSLANTMGIPLNMTKLQKLMFIVYGYFLTRGHTIFSETPRAWPFGPVFPKVRENVNFNLADPMGTPDFELINKDEELVHILNHVVSKYAHYSAVQLSNWSHMEGSPWDITTKQPGFKWNNVIPDYYIAYYFSKYKVIEQS